MNECENLDFSQHFQWILNLISRIKKATTNSAPLLNLSFIEKLSIPNIDTFIPNDFQQNILYSPPNAIHYAILSSILTKNKNFDEITQKINEDLFLFEYSISKLSSIGYKPRSPCLPYNLIRKSYIDHCNLCMCFEYVVADKSLQIEKLLDDIRNLPRSFFVLSSRGSRPNSSKQEQRSNDLFFYPANIEDAVRLWLSKFPCLYGLKDLTKKPRSVKSSQSCNSSLPIINPSKNLNAVNLCNSIELLQNEICDGFHIAAVLARAFPQRINKNDILQNDSETNWSISKEILEKEIGAFVPSSFPVTDNLFMCFISDLFYATRSGAKKFVRIDNHMLKYNINTNNNNTSISCLNSNNNIKNNKNIIIQSKSANNEDLPILNSNSNSMKMVIRDVNSITASIVFKSSKINCNNSRKPKSSMIKSKNFKQLNIDEDENEKEEFLKIYRILNENSNFFKAELTESSLLSLVHSLVKLLHAKNTSDKTFKKLWRILETKKQSSEQFANGRTLIREISKAKPRTATKNEHFSSNNDGFGFSEIDLRASQKVIDFARLMISQSIDENSNSCWRVFRPGFSISTQTSSMTHSMSFVREVKSVKVMSTVTFKQSVHHKQKFACPETKSVGNQTDGKVNSNNNNNANWKRASNLVRFDTISYPYGESPSGFSRPSSGYSSFRKQYISPVCAYNSNRKCSFAISDEDGKQVLIRNSSQKT